MEIIQLDDDGYFSGTTIADESPLDPGVWIFPRNTVDAPIPVVPEGQRARWDFASETWQLEDIPTAPEPPAPDPATAQAQIVTWTQYRLDSFARERGYDGILSACTYAGSTIPRFAAEGQACVALRDATWAALYAIQEAAIAGTRPAPTGYADIEGELPALEWPAGG